MYGAGSSCVQALPPLLPGQKPTWQGRCTHPILLLLTPPHPCPGLPHRAVGLDSKLEREVAIKVARYEDVIGSLQKLLEAERRRTKVARAAHTAELAARTELQALLRQCVEDVRDRRRTLGAFDPT